MKRSTRRNVTEVGGTCQAFAMYFYPRKDAWVLSEPVPGGRQVSLVVEDVGVVAIGAGKSYRAALGELEHVLNERGEDRRRAANRVPPRVVSQVVNAVFNALFGLDLEDRPMFREELLTLGLGTMPADERALRDAWRRAARATHPDAGGSTEAFKKVRNAAEKLAAHMGVKL